jgi:hypothetical protein
VGEKVRDRLKKGTTMKLHYFFLPLSILVLGHAGYGQEKAVREISIMTPNGWWLRLGPDGSGGLGFGSSIQHTASFPKGTIELGPTLKKLRSVTQKQGRIGTHFAVAFHEEGSSSTISVYTKDAKLILGLFEKGHKAIPAKDRQESLEKLWRQKPPSGVEEK